MGALLLMLHCCSPLADLPVSLGVLRGVVFVISCSSCLTTCRIWGGILAGVVSLPRFPLELLCSGCPTEFPRADCVVLSPPHHDPLRQPVCSAGRAPVGCRAIPLLLTFCSIQVSS